MSYYFSKTLNIPYEEAIQKATEVLKEHGFGVLTEIDVSATLKKKIDVDFPKYKILGACNPKMAHQALQKEEHIGLMLPCNVIVRELEGGQTEVAAVDPVASMRAIQNKELHQVATQVQSMLKDVIEKI
ncbi:MAG: DUF302 domain-containing protein [Bdellovibrio sp.]|nr:MAG: DUF302 domain-containing protein [Bdellovibrio sp.]